MCGWYAHLLQEVLPLESTVVRDVVGEETWVLAVFGCRPRKHQRVTGCESCSLGQGRQKRSSWIVWEMEWMSHSWSSNWIELYCIIDESNIEYQIHTDFLTSAHLKFTCSLRSSRARGKTAIRKSGQLSVAELPLKQSESQINIISTTLVQALPGLPW